MRDSSKGSMEQPYTLMVLYQDKVFNIQIKRTHDEYLLGTGLKTSEVHQLSGSPVILFLLFTWFISPFQILHHFTSYISPSAMTTDIFLGCCLTDFFLSLRQTFPSVSDIISHYQQTPLLLIDSKNRGSGQQNHCALMYPAGY